MVADLSGVGPLCFFRLYVTTQAKGTRVLINVDRDFFISIVCVVDAMSHRKEQRVSLTCITAVHTKQMLLTACHLGGILRPQVFTITARYCLRT